jgi:hypothetical protein
MKQCYARAGWAAQPASHSALPLPGFWDRNLDIISTAGDSEHCEASPGVRTHSLLLLGLYSNIPSFKLGTLPQT